MKRAAGSEPMPQGGPPPYDVQRAAAHNETANFETTFDVDGHIETIQDKQQQM